ncbi:branched-chain amino acid ABC transporter permease [Yinghuangia seranimata]|uniref:branched-chain amino acid ABC transporter permease n=1 Tax=Yinghuangia seranimata TaxID=408067 RepID=UPI003CCFAE1A
MNTRLSAVIAMSSRYGTVARRAALAVVVVWLLVLPQLVDTYTLVLATQALVFGLLAVGVGVLTGHAGLATMGQVAPYAVGAYTTAWLTRHDITAGLLQLPAAALAGALFAAVTGIVVIRARGVVALMLTLAVGELTATAAVQWKEFTGGSDGVSTPPARIFPGGAELFDDQDIYLYVLVVALVVAGITALVLRSPAGLLLAGVRDNEDRMRAAGHPVDRYLLLTYTGAGAISGISGALLMTYARYVSPQDVGFDISALALLAVVIGGVRSTAGAFAGAGLIVFTRDKLGNWWPGHAPLFLGILFLIAVYLLPNGAAGVAQQLRSLADRMGLRVPGLVPRTPAAAGAGDGTVPASGAPVPEEADAR